MLSAAICRRSGHDQVEENLGLYRFGVIAVLNAHVTAIGVRLKLDFQIRLTDGLQICGTLYAGIGLLRKGLSMVSY
jgi:hypothetical protein